ncbi:MAG: hypothetical protein JNL80_18525 [Phycisphaerae bacterium]|jgi:hypothetical protein|nr:hypothetical protein [Phycisphaerae bacterium]
MSATSIGGIRLAERPFIDIPREKASTAPAFRAVMKETFGIAVSRPKPGSDEANLAIEEKARDSAETLVAQALIAPLLAQIRETNHAAEPFGVSDAEKRLGPVFDEQVAVGIVKRSRFDLVDSVKRSLLRQVSTASNRMTQTDARTATSFAATT